MTAKLEWLFFGLLVGLCLVTGWVTLTPEIDGGHGSLHPEYETMLQGGDGKARMERLWLAGWLFGALQIVFFVACLALGSGRRGQTGRFKWALWPGGLVYIAVFTAMVFAYRDSLVHPDQPLFGSVPISTAVMLYGVWPMPIYFMVVYMWLFDREILTTEDMEAFEKLVATRRRQQQQEAD